MFLTLINQTNFYTALLVNKFVKLSFTLTQKTRWYFTFKLIQIVLIIMSDMFIIIKTQDNITIYGKYKHPESPLQINNNSRLE